MTTVITYNTVKQTPMKQSSMTTVATYHDSTVITYSYS